MVKSKSIWSDQNHFGHVEGQGMREMAAKQQQDKKPSLLKLKKYLEGT